MKTNNSLCGLKNLLDIISFEENSNVNLANAAVMAADQELRPFGFLHGWTSGFDEDNGHVVIFLPLYDLTKITDEERNAFYEIVRKKFEEANFEILHEGDLGGDVYFDIGFASHNYILKVHE